MPGRRSPPNAEKSGLLGKAADRVVRYTEILRVLIRYGFTDLTRSVDREVYRRLRHKTRRGIRARRSWSRPERMRRALEELGPAFVKIGQILSHRPDLLPPDWIAEFSKLRVSVPPIPEQELLAVLTAELGSPPEEVFREFDINPIASASIAQVHRALLTSEEEPGGIPVAVKVQRPDIARIIEADLAILADIAGIAERHLAAAAPFRPAAAVRELQRAMRNELDFRIEADNLERFRKNFADDPHILAPAPYRDFSTSRILTMDFIDGVPVSDIEALDRLGIDRQVLARRGADAVLSQIFIDRFFHSDPHGHNILVDEKGRITFLDFGQAGIVLPSQRKFLVEMTGAFARLDSSRAVRTILNWSGHYDPDVVRRLTSDMENLVEGYLSRPFGQLNFGALAAELFGIIRRYRIEIPSQFYLLAKAMTTIEDIASSLDPDFDFLKATRPFVRKMVRSELSPDQIADKIGGLAAESVDLLTSLPEGIRSIVDQMKSGTIRMNFELKELDRLDTTFKRVVTRLSAAVLLAAMIMGSSLLVQSGIRPLIYGIPVIGILGFMLSAFTGLFLLIDLWRHR